MKVLLDEDVPLRLRSYFPEEHEVETVEYRGWKGLKNGALLRAAESHFDVLVTIDRHLPLQQNVRSFALGVIVLLGATNRLPDLIVLMPQVMDALNAIGAGEVVMIAPPQQ